MRTHIAALQKSTQNVQKFYKQQKLDTQDAVENRRKLEEMRKKCREYKTTVNTLRDHEKEKDDNLARRVADIEKKEKALEKAKEEAENSRTALEK